MLCTLIWRGIIEIKCMFIRNQKDALIYEFINKLKNIVSYNIESSHAPSLHFLL